MSNIITFIPKNYDTAKLYKMEEDITELIIEASRELQKICEVKEYNIYETSIPSELYSILCAFGKASIKPALMFLESKGYKITETKP